MFKKTSLMRSLTALLPLLFWCSLVMVTYLMLIELPPKQGGWPYWDKVQHLLVFMVLAGLALMAYPKRSWLSVGLLMLYGAVVEWMQAVFTVTRMPSMGDWLADDTGVVLALILCKWIAALRPKKVKV